MSAQEQLVFELPHRAALEDVDFLVSACNQEAVRLIDDWPDWPNRIHSIIGPAGCGKSHLGNVWLLKAGGRKLAGADLGEPSRWAEWGATPLLLEDLDRGPIDETGLFHLLNHAGEQSLSVLITAREAPSRWRVELPDLASRLRSLPVAAIGPPDDTLLRAVLLKQFLDRQLNVEPNVIDFLAKRMERSMEAVGRLVAALDREALAEGRRITRQFAAEVLARSQVQNGQSA